MRENSKRKGSPNNNTEGEYKAMSDKTLKICALQLNNPFLLAPLAGITDKAMRSLCASAGASLTYTEMISAKGLWYGDKNTRRLLDISPIGDEAGDPFSSSAKDFAPARCSAGRSDFPVAFQLFGSEPEIMERAAMSLALGKWMKRGEFLEDVAEDAPAGEYTSGPAANGPTIPALLDLNAGCPVPKIVRNGEGSALLKDPDKLYDVASAMVRGVRAAHEELAAQRSESLLLPVTAKIRMGFERGENNAVECAKVLDAAGISAITVHGRTREQYYDGRADWQAIADVKRAVRIPVIGNGDIYSGSDALRMMYETGCDGVMIARGALGNPWIFEEAIAMWEARNADVQADYVPPTQNQRIEMLLHHLNLVIADKGEKIAVKEMRKHIAWYTKGMRGATAVRRAVNNIDEAEPMKREIRRLVR